MSRFLKINLLLVVLAFLFSACGGGGSTGSDGQPSSGRVLQTGSVNFRVNPGQVNRVLMQTMTPTPTATPGPLFAVDVSVLDKVTREPVVPIETFIVERDEQNNAMPVEGEILNIVEGNYALLAEGKDQNDVLTGTFEVDVNVRAGEVSRVNVPLGSPTPGAGLALDAIDDLYTLTGATVSTSITTGVLANDLNLGTNPVVTSDSASMQGGTITMGTDGDFTYTPPMGGLATADTFNYTVTNDEGQSDTATVTITPLRVFYVDNGAPGGGTGSKAAPFNDIGDAIIAANMLGDIIFVETGIGPYAGGVVIPNTIQLIGKGSGLHLDPIGVPTAEMPGITTLVEAAGTPPMIENAGGPGVSMGMSSQLRGFTIGNTMGPGVVAPTVSDVTIAQNTINQVGAGAAPGFGSTQGGGGNGISIVNCGGTVTISNNTIVGNPMGGKGIFIENNLAVVSGTTNVNLNQVMNTGEQCLDVIYTNTPASNFNTGNNNLMNPGMANRPDAVDAVGIFTTGNAVLSATISGDTVSTSTDASDGFDLFGIDSSQLDVVMTGVNLTVTQSGIPAVSSAIDAGYEGTASGSMTFGSTSTPNTIVYSTTNALQAVALSANDSARGDFVFNGNGPGSGTDITSTANMGQSGIQMFINNTAVPAGGGSTLIVHAMEIFSSDAACRITGTTSAAANHRFLFQDSTLVGTNHAIAFSTAGGVATFCADVMNNDSMGMGNFQNNIAGLLSIEDAASIDANNTFVGPTMLNGANSVVDGTCGLSAGGGA